MIEHLPIVRFIARRIHERLPQHAPIEDLYSAGILGLLDAFGRFDPSKEVKFRAYAQFRIRGAILDSLRTLDWSPRQLRRKGRAVEQAIQTLIAQFHRSPTDVEIAQKLNIPLADYQQLLGDLNGLAIGSLNSERTEDSDDEGLDLVPGRAEDDPLFRYLDGEMRERLTAATNDLPERERPDHDPVLLRRGQHEGDRTHHRCGGITSLAATRLRCAAPSSPAFRFQTNTEPRNTDTTSKPLQSDKARHRLKSDSFTFCLSPAR
jgi:FliA/WhiG family RNA polymerase sigma factor